jgi:phage tail sheath protein FI
MATAPTYPGVYIEESTSAVHTITGVATSITAFVGYCARGPVGVPTRVQSFTEFVRTFGGLSSLSTVSYAVQQYFQNGGSDALIVRVANAGATPAKPGKLTLGTGTAQVKLEAANPGAWSTQLRVRIDLHTRDELDATPRLFNLTVKDMATGQTESFRNLDPGTAIDKLIEQQSSLIRVTAVPTTRPVANTEPAPGDDPFGSTTSTGFPTTGASAGDDGAQDAGDIFPASQSGGMFALDTADLVNLICIPPLTRDGTLTPTQRGTASEYAKERRALFIVDPDPAWNGAADVATNLTAYTAGMVRPSAAVYYPQIRTADALTGTLDSFPPCGAVAGVMARTDASRGVWKAPAGQDATLVGVSELSVKLTDGQNGQINPIGVNALRTFPLIGPVVWGARTLDGADALASQWKYVPVRRLALYLEESLFRGTQWVVFEPNDEPLWAQIRLNVGAFMQNLFRQGAFQGTSPRDAYFVKCDGETTTQNDIDLGIVNIVVGFAPLKPAEFVIIQIQQIAGQVAA